MFKHLLPVLFAVTACTTTDDEPSSRTSPINTIVLVHGAWADGSSWDRVTPLLQKKGFRVIAVHLPLSSLGGLPLLGRHARTKIGIPPVPSNVDSIMCASALSFSKECAAPDPANPW